MPRRKAHTIVRRAEADLEHRKNNDMRTKIHTNDTGLPDIQANQAFADYAMLGAGMPPAIYHVAIHLGEVLWVLDQRDGARKIWTEALKAHPDNELLRDTVKRFQPQ